MDDEREELEQEQEEIQKQQEEELKNQQNLEQQRLEENSNYDDDGSNEKSPVEKAANAYMFYKKLKTLKQLKIVAFLASAASPLLLIFFKVMIILVIMFLVIAGVLGAVNTIYSYGDRVYNYLNYGSFKESDEVFLETLQLQYDRYYEFHNIEDDLDLPLVMSTINYGKIFDPAGFETTATGLFSPDDSDSFIPSDEFRSFYRIMNDQLGKVYTLNWQERKLLAHLVGIRFDVKCVNIPTVGGEQGFFTEAGQLGSEVIESFEDVNSLLTSIGMEHFSDKNAIDMLPLPFHALKNFFSLYSSAIVFAYDMMSYREHDLSYWEVKMAERWQSAQNQNLIPFLKRVGQATAENYTSCGSGQLGVPIMVVYQDYDLYREYLVDYFIPTFYINCGNCQYRGLDKDDPYREIIIERMANEIFMFKDVYIYFFPTHKTDIVRNLRIGTGEFIFNPEDCNVSPRPTLENVLHIRYKSDLNNEINYSEPPSKSGPFGGCVNQPMGYRRIFGGRNWHRGVDFPLFDGSEVYAFASGKVTRSGWHDSYGWWVEINHGEIDDKTITSRYAHFESASSLVVGQEITGGDLVGYVGTTGASTGDHLHFEIRVNNDPINPIPLLQEVLDGTSDFNTKMENQYFAMADYWGSYCDNDSPVAVRGNLPTAYAMLAVAFGNETNPNDVADFICDHYESDRTRVIDDQLAVAKYDMIGIKTNPELLNVFNNVNAGNKVLVHIQGGPYNPNNSGNYLVIMDYYQGEYLVMDPTSKERSRRPVKAEELSSGVLNFVVNNNIWIFSDDVTDIDRPSGGQPGGSVRHFNESAWENHLRREIRQSNLLTLKPRDANNFFVGSQITEDDWVRLFTAMSWYESRHVPDLEYPEVNPCIWDYTTNACAISTGLFQMSQGSIRAYAGRDDRFIPYQNIVTDDFKDPYTNISIAVILFDRLATIDNCISCRRTDGRWGGAARYWSVLRNPTPLCNIRCATLQKPLNACGC